MVGNGLTSKEIRMMELPTMAAMTYTSSTANLDEQWWNDNPQASLRQFQLQGEPRRPMLHAAVLPHPTETNPRKEENMSTARIVKVFIADSDENVPLDKRVLFTGEEKLTDLTDQELFFEIPIKQLLDKHNAEVRTKTVNKKLSKDREVFLEPARIRDLKMVVVNVASF